MDLKRLELHGIWSCMYNFYRAKQLLPAEKKTGFCLKMKLGEERLLMVGFIGLMQVYGKIKQSTNTYLSPTFPNWKVICSYFCYISKKASVRKQKFCLLLLYAEIWIAIQRIMSLITSCFWATKPQIFPDVHYVYLLRGVGIAF